MEKEQKGSRQSSQLVKIKGTAWLLEDISKAQLNGSQQAKELQQSQIGTQKKKWKKNISNRFEGYSKTIERGIENKFKKQFRTHNTYQFDSLRKGSINYSLLPHRQRLSYTFHNQCHQMQETLFNLHRKQKNFEIQIAKVNKLKEVTNIFQRKKQFYDSCVEHYFSNQEQEINRNITRMAQESFKNAKILPKSQLIAK